MAGRRTSRRKESGIPKAPFDYGQTVKILLADGTTKIGTVSFIAWMLWPPQHSFEVEADGTTYATHGGGFPHTDRPAIRALTADMEEEL